MQLIKNSQGFVQELNIFLAL